MHSAPRLTKVMVEADSGSGSFVYKVFGEDGEQQHLKNRKLKVQYRKDADGEWADAVTIEGAADTLEEGIPVAAVDNLQPDGEHSFRLVSTAESAVDLPLSQNEQEQTSEESDPLMLPAAEYWRAVNIQPFRIDQNTGNRVPGSVTIIRWYWDFEKGEKAKQSKRFEEAPYPGVPLWDTGYMFRKIGEENGRPAVQIVAKNKREMQKMGMQVEMTLTSGGRSPTFAANEWTAPPEEDEGDGEESAGEGEKPPTSDDEEDEDNLFGGDDEDD